MNDYSQSGEQPHILAYADRLVRTGRFLDLGAYDGTTGSNSLALAELGWTGVCVEPSAWAFEKLLATHRGRTDRVLCVQALVEPEPGLKRFYYSGSDQVSTTSEEHREIWRRQVSFIETFVPAVTLQQLFNEVGDGFDVVSIDTEGSAIQLLEQLRTMDAWSFVGLVVCEFQDGEDEYAIHAICGESEWKVRVRTPNNVVLERNQLPVDVGQLVVGKAGLPQGHVHRVEPRRAIVNVGTDFWYPHGSHRLEVSLDTVGELAPDRLIWKDALPPGSPPHSEIPYAFKVYALREAQAQGYDQALWIDSSCWAFRPLTPVWAEIDRNGYWLRPDGARLGEWCSDIVLERFGLTRDEVWDWPLPEGKLIGIDFRDPVALSWLQFWEDNLASFVGPGDNDLRQASMDPRCLGHRWDISVGAIACRRLGVPMFERQFLSWPHEREVPAKAAVMLSEGMAWW